VTDVITSKELRIALHILQRYRFTGRGCTRNNRTRESVANKIERAIKEYGVAACFVGAPERDEVSAREETEAVSSFAFGVSPGGK